MKLKWTEILAVIGSLLILLAIINAAFGGEVALDPNQPRQIVLPKAIPVPAVYKCPVHGITDATLAIEVDEIRKTYCKKCAMTLICDFFDLNLPKLKIVKND